jgi:alpha-L-fucosidase
MMWPAAAGAATCSPTDFKNPDGSIDIAGYLQCSAPSVSDSVVAPGGTITFKGGGFAPNSVVTITLHSDPILLGTTTADSRGNFTFEAAIPADLPPGEHALEAAGVDPSGNPLTVSQPITVVTAEVLGEVQTAGTSGTLPYTGADIARYAGLGLGLAVVGGAAVWGARRAKANQAA